MALETVLSVCLDCTNSKFVVKDDTKPYSATANAGGWGAPNPATSDVTSSLLYITSPSGNVVSVIDISADLPSTDVNDSYDYVPSNNSQAFEDGIWQFEWVVKGSSGGDGFYKKATKLILVDCSVKCCAQKLGATLDGGCGCGGDSSKAIEARMTYKSMLDAFDCGNHNRAKYLLGKLQSICGNNCKGC